MSLKSKQSGSMLIIVIFVIVVIGFLASSLSRTSWSDRDSNTRSILGTQAWLLSHSVNEYVMTQFYPDLDPESDSDIASNCSSPMSASHWSFAESLLSQATMTCQLETLQCSSRGELGGLNFFVLETSVICGSGIYEVQRNQEVWVRE